MKEIYHFSTHLCHHGNFLGDSELIKICYKPLRYIDAHFLLTPRDSHQAEPESPCSALQPNYLRSHRLRLEQGIGFCRKRKSFLIFPRSFGFGLSLTEKNLRKTGIVECKYGKFIREVREGEGWIKMHASECRISTHLR